MNRTGKITLASRRVGRMVRGFHCMRTSGTADSLRESFHVQEGRARLRAFDNCVIGRTGELNISVPLSRGVCRKLVRVTRGF